MFNIDVNEDTILLEILFLLSADAGMMWWERCARGWEEEQKMLPSNIYFISILKSCSNPFL